MSAPIPAEEKDLLINTDLSFNRFNDAYIKFLFASEAHKEFLLDLINAVFDDKRPACISGKITDLTVEDSSCFPSISATSRADWTSGLRPQPAG